MPLHRSRLKMSVIFHQKFEDFSSKFRNFANVHLNFFVFLTDFDEKFSGFHQIYRKFQKSLKLLHRNSKFGVIAYILPTFYLHFTYILPTFYLHFRELFGAAGCAAGAGASLAAAATPSA